MLEFLFILYILLFFIFPVPALGATLGLGTIYFVRRKYLALKLQPAGGRKIIYLAALTQTCNLAASALVALILASLVHFLIVDYLYLFLFNLAFCFLVAARWFDFTHRIYRHFILKWMPPSRREALRLQGRSVFVICLGLRKHTGIGWGLVPTLVDAGLLQIRNEDICFEGVLSAQKFTPEILSGAEKKSSEKIKVHLAYPPPPFHPEAFLIVVKEQFYPFKSRQTRDEILQGLLKIHGSKRDRAEEDRSPAPRRYAALVELPPG